MMSRPVLPPRIMSGSMATEQPGSVLMFIACATTKGLVNRHGLAMLMSEGYDVAGDHIDVSGL